MLFGGGTTRKAAQEGVENAAERGGFNLAVGLGDDLFDFAKSTNSTTYFHRYGSGFVESKFLKMANEATEINFNVGGKFSFGRYADWQRAGRPDGLEMITNFELDSILSNPELRKKTNFFMFPKTQ